MAEGVRGRRPLPPRAGAGRGAAASSAARCVGADLTVEAEVERLFEEAAPLDVCAAVAGVWPEEDVPVWELPLERWEATLRANLTATFLTARGFLRGVARAATASSCSSARPRALFGEAGHADYAAAKSAIVGGLLLSLKNEVVRVAPRARVNAVCPGWTESPMTRGSLDEETLRRVTRTMPLEKVAQPEDVAAQVVVLASDELSGHVTGQIVTVAGGMEGRVLHELRKADGGPRGARRRKLHSRRMIAVSPRRGVAPESAIQTRT